MARPLRSIIWASRVKNYHELKDQNSTGGVIAMACPNTPRANVLWGLQLSSHTALPPPASKTENDTSKSEAK